MPLRSGGERFKMSENDERNDTEKTVPDKGVGSQAGCYVAV